ncbi:hypothetical protein GGH12_002794 [Coemansia sp. RSA 1822]|nr:hypothetical protein IW147_000558 [Coemansia sp. RSA 720]KAJ2563095.1 hypothetical protein GGH12_002794 [Coemansia sp. RSA 1822]
MDIQRLVDAYIIGLGDNADNSSLRQTLINHIVKGDMSLLELVQALGSYLASEEAGRRSKGAHVLSDVLTELPESAIPAQATTRLVQFFCARLSDATCVPHVLASISALQQLSSFTDQCSVDVLRALFKEVHVQSFQHSTRSTAYKLLDQIIQSHPQVAKMMGDDTVLGFAQMLDGEKDPRSLMIAFQIIPKLAKLVDIKNNADDIFDVVFCYFPITFKNREGDPSSISPELLKSSLRAAITCSAHFGEMAIKPLVEKTTATSQSVKIDAYETLTAATQTYSPEVFASEMEVLIEQIREDVVMAADEKVVNAALDTLEAVYSVVSPAAPLASSAAGQTPEIDETTTSLDYVLKDAIFQLTAEDVKNSDQVGKLLLAAARSSAYNCNVVSDAVLPIVVERLGSTEVLTLRRELMDVLNYVLSASCDIRRKAECLEADKDNLLNIYRLDASVPLDKEYSFLHITRLKGITLLILMPQFLDKNETSLALQTISRAAIERNEDENVNKEATHLLVQLSQSNPEQVQTTVLPMFFTALCEDMVAVHKIASLLNALGAIGVAASEVLLPILGGLASVITTGSLAFSHYVPTITTIRKMIETAAATTNGDTVCPELMTKVVAPLLSWISESPDTGHQNQHSIVVEIAKATAAVFSKLDTETQGQYLKPVFDRYSAIALDPDNTSDPLCQLLPLYSALVCACTPQTKLPVEDLSRYLSGLASAALKTTSTVHRDVSFEIIAATINKSNAGTRGELAKSVLECADSVGSGVAHILLRHWLARALVNCNDKAGYECVRWLLDQITQGSLYSTEAAEGFNIILGNHDWSVTPATHGVFKLLSKQRFYATVVPEITSNFNSASDDTIKANLLVVLTHSVQHMPKSVLMSGIEDVVPLLLSAIRLTSGSLKAASIRTITMVVLETPDTLKSKVTSSIIPLLIGSLTYSDAANTVQVRQATLDALSLVPEKYAYSVIQGARRDVLRALVKARDDRKRLVRADAVKAYNKWLNFGDV